MYSIGEIATIVGGRLLRSDGAVPRRIVHDSRDVLEGDLFIALRGQRVDGHAFLADAFARGACGALISDPKSSPADARNLVVVDDPLRSLHRLATTWRETLDATFIGITGSNGKTTTRSLLAHLLRDPDGALAVYSAPKNYNTEVGLPLALLAMPEAASIGLFELGAERPGDVGLLADILAPGIGLITSVGPSHLDGFGSVEAVAREKWSLVEGLPGNGYAVVDADSPHLRRLAKEMPGRCLTVGFEQGEIRGRIERDVPRLTLRVDDPPMRLVCPLIGRHNAANLLLAAVTADRLGVPADEIEARAKTFPPVPHRLQPIPVPFGTILDDTYNANPASTAGALRTLARLGGDRTHRVFVFGEMLDLGPDADRYHCEVLDLALHVGIDTILPVGRRAVAACRDRPSPPIAIVDRERIADAIRNRCKGPEDSLVLVKGSRALALERLVDELVNAVE
jgi:UDP-N-acetylmuramoyl-tripeptide--D-alanyl-D-alanine ligase